MSAIEDLINTISQVGGGIDTALTHIETADSQGSQTMDAFQLAGAEDKIIQLQGVIDKLNEVRTSLTAAKSEAEQAHQLAVAVRGLVGAAAAVRSAESAPRLDVDAAAASVPDDYPVDKLTTLSYSDLHHVLNGDPDDPSSGGHAHGRGRPGKTEFPPEWSAEDVKDAIESVAGRPRRCHAAPNGSWLATATYRNVTVTSVVQPDGRITAGWPKGGPGVHRNPSSHRQGRR